MHVQGVQPGQVRTQAFHEIRIVLGSRAAPHHFGQRGGTRPHHVVGMAGRGHVLGPKLPLSAEDVPLLGGAQEIPRDRIDRLLELRENYYHITGRHPGYKKYGKEEK